MKFVRWACLLQLLWFLLACANWASLGFLNGGGAADHFRRAEILFGEGRYAEAVKEYRTVVSRFPNDALADDAQYKAAYTELYYKNTAADYEAAGKDFQKLIQKFPESSWTREAENWLALLAQLDSLKKDKEKLKADLQRLLDLDIQSEKKRREVK